MTPEEQMAIAIFGTELRGLSAHQRHQLNHIMATGAPPRTLRTFCTIECGRPVFHAV